MAKADITWGGKAILGNIATFVSIAWGDNPYTWNDVSLAIEIDGLGTKRRRELLAKLLKDKKKKERFVRLVCRINGEKVYDMEKAVNDYKIKVADADLVVNNVLGRIRVSDPMEIEDVI